METELVIGRMREHVAWSCSLRENQQYFHDFIDVLDCFCFYFTRANMNLVSLVTNKRNKYASGTRNYSGIPPFPICLKRLCSDGKNSSLEWNHKCFKLKSPPYVIPEWTGKTQIESKWIFWWSSHWWRLLLLAECGRHRLKINPMGW